MNELSGLFCFTGYEIRERVFGTCTVLADRKWTLIRMPFEVEGTHAA